MSTQNKSTYIHTCMRVRAHTKLHDDLTNDLYLYGFTTICSTPGPCHSGVCIFVNSDLCVNKDDVMSSSLFSESVWCHFPLTGSDCLLLGVTYHSPNSDATNFKYFCIQANNAGVLHLH